MHCTDATTALVAGLRCRGEECIGMAFNARFHTFQRFAKQTAGEGYKRITALANGDEAFCDAQTLVYQLDRQRLKSLQIHWNARQRF